MYSGPSFYITFCAEISAIPQSIAGWAFLAPAVTLHCADLMVRLASAQGMSADAELLARYREFVQHVVNCSCECGSTKRAEEMRGCIENGTLNHDALHHLLAGFGVGGLHEDPPPVWAVERHSV